MLPGGSSDDDIGTGGVHFIQVFVIVWGGSCLVTINAQLLRAKLYDNMMLRLLEHFIIILLLQQQQQVILPVSMYTGLLPVTISGIINDIQNSLIIDCSSCHNILMQTRNNHVCFSLVIMG